MDKQQYRLAIEITHFRSNEIKGELDFRWSSPFGRVDSYLSWFEWCQEYQIFVTGGLAAIITCEGWAIHTVVNIVWVDWALRRSVTLKVKGFHCFGLTEFHSSPAGINSGAVSCRIEEVEDVGICLKVESTLNIWCDECSDFGHWNCRLVNCLVCFWSEEFESATRPSDKFKHNYSNFNGIKSLEVNSRSSSGWRAHIILLAKSFVGRSI